MKRFNFINNNQWLNNVIHLFNIRTPHLTCKFIVCHYMSMLGVFALF